MSSSYPPAASTSLAGLASLSSASVVKAATASDSIVAPSTLINHPSAIKAQCKINGSGVVQGSQAFGFSSVSRSSTGVYVFTLSSAMADANYGISPCLDDTGGCTHTVRVSAQSTTSFTLKVYQTCDTGTALLDLGMSVSVTGKLA